MISLNIIIIVVAAPPMDHLVAAEKAYQDIKAINDLAIFDLNALIGI